MYCHECPLEVSQPRTGCSVLLLQTVNKHYICERPATNPVPVAPTPDNAPLADCSTMPAMPQGAVAPVALINAGGPSMCNYFAADNADSPGNAAAASRQCHDREHGLSDQPTGLIPAGLCNGSCLHVF